MLDSLLVVNHKMDNFDKYISKANDLVEDKNEISEKGKEIDAASLVLDKFGLGKDSALNDLLSDMRSYISKLKEENDERQKKLENDTRELKESLDERWNKISDALKKLEYFVDTQQILLDEDKKHKKLKDLLDKNQLISDVVEEAGENIHEVVSYVMGEIAKNDPSLEYIIASPSDIHSSLVDISKDDPILENIFVRNDVTFSFTKGVVLTGLLVALCGSMLKRKGK